MKTKNRKRLKGFTLIELLAVIAILALIVVIVIPFSLSFREGADDQADEISYTSLESAARTYAIEYKKDEDWLDYDKDQGLLYVCVSVRELINTGYLSSNVTNNEKILDTTSIMIIKNTNEVIISEEIVTSDNEYCPFYFVQKPSVSFAEVPTTNSITVNAHCETGNRATVSNYMFKINDGEYIDKGTTSTYTFDKLKDDTEFKISVKCINSYGKENEVAKDVSTYELKVPEVTYVSDDTIKKSRTATVKFNNSNVTSPYNLVKISGTFSVNRDIYECSVSNTSVSCSSSKIAKGTSVTSSNKWYKINNTNAVITFTSVSTLSARLFDGYNYKDTTTYNIINIDNQAPVLGDFVINNQKYNTVSNNNYYSELGLRISVSDADSGIASVKYCTTTSSKCTPEIDVAVSNGNVIVQYAKSSKSKTRVCVLATDKAGNSTTKCNTNSYYFDNTPPTKVVATYKPTECTQRSFNNSATESDGYLWKREYYYGESASNLKSFKSDTTTSTNSTSEITDRLETKKKYYYKVITYNRSGLKTESEVIEFIPIYHVETAYNDLNRSCYYQYYRHADGYFVKYGNQIYAMYGVDAYTDGYKGIMAGQYKASTWYNRASVLQQYVNTLPSNYQSILYASKAGTGYIYFFDCEYSGNLFYCSYDRSHVGDSYDISGYAILPEGMEARDISEYEWGRKNFSLGNIFYSSTHSSGYWGDMIGFGYKTYRYPQTDSDGYVSYGYNAHMDSYCMNRTSCSMDYDGTATLYVRPVLVFQEGYEFLSGNGTYEKPFVIGS